MQILPDSHASLSQPVQKIHKLGAEQTSAFQEDNGDQADSFRAERRSGCFYPKAEEKTAEVLKRETARDDTMA